MKQQKSPTKLLEKNTEKLTKKLLSRKYKNDIELDKSLIGLIFWAFIMRLSDYLAGFDWFENIRKVVFLLDSFLRFVITADWRETLLLLKVRTKTLIRSKYIY